MKKACVIGAGPNGLSAAIVLARAGWQTEVFEAEKEPGGAARTLELTLPGFRHDFGSAVYPLGVGSPFFQSLGLDRFGLNWVHSPAAVAHPFDDGSAISLRRGFKGIESLGRDASAWRRLVEPFADRWFDFAQDALGPVLRIPRHPWFMAKFGVRASLPATVLSRQFRDQRTRALFGGLAAHSMLSLREPLSSAAALLLAAAAHSVGWPIALGGAQAIPEALCRCLLESGGVVHTSRRISDMREVSDFPLVLCDLTPKQLLKLAPGRFTSGYRRRLERFRYGPGVFKVDYALSAPIPWKAAECLQAITVHLGGTFEQIAESEEDVRTGRHAERPFVLLAQPTLFDPTRAPSGKHIAWAYCHVPNGSSFDMLARIERQIERFAPGFRDLVMARHVLPPAALERMDGNLVGGDIGAGAMDALQILRRPAWRAYATSDRQIYICSASTPPGGGVHGMCGYHAARLALAQRGE